MCAFGTNIFGLFFCMCPCIFGCACLNVCILMYRTCVAGSGVCGCVMIHPTSTFIPLLLVLYTCCCLYYPPVSFPWCLYRVVPGLYKHLYPPWWWCGQRCLYDHLSSTDLIAHQPSPAPDRLIVSQEHQFSVLF